MTKSICPLFLGGLQPLAYFLVLLGLNGFTIYPPKINILARDIQATKIPRRLFFLNQDAPPNWVGHSHKPIKCRRGCTSHPEKYEPSGGKLIVVNQCSSLPPPNALRTHVQSSWSRKNISYWTLLDHMDHPQQGSGFKSLNMGISTPRWLYLKSLPRDCPCANAVWKLPTGFTTFSRKFCMGNLRWNPVDGSNSKVSNIDFFHELTSDV